MAQHPNVRHVERERDEHHLAELRLGQEGGDVCSVCNTGVQVVVEKRKLTRPGG